MLCSWYYIALDTQIFSNYWMRLSRIWRILQIIHSKYFPVSDWFINKTTRIIPITSCCSPNLERIVVILNQGRQKHGPLKIIEPMTSKMQPAADYWAVDRENLGTRLCYVGWAEKQRAKWRNSFKNEKIFWMNDLQNSSYPIQPHSIIAEYTPSWHMTKLIKRKK